MRVERSWEESIVDAIRQFRAATTRRQLIAASDALVAVTHALPEEMAWPIPIRNAAQVVVSLADMLSTALADAKMRHDLDAALDILISTVESEEVGDAENYEPDEAESPSSITETGTQRTQPG